MGHVARSLRGQQRIPFRPSSRQTTGSSCQTQRFAIPGTLSTSASSGSSPDPAPSRFFHCLLVRTVGAARICANMRAPSHEARHDGRTGGETGRYTIFEIPYSMVFLDPNTCAWTGHMYESQPTARCQPWLSHSALCRGMTVRGWSAWEQDLQPSC